MYNDNVYLDNVAFKKSRSNYSPSPISMFLPQFVARYVIVVTKQVILRIFNCMSMLS